MQLSEAFSGFCLVLSASGLVPIRCQQESPVWGVVRKEALRGTEQLSCDAAWLWNSLIAHSSVMRQRDCAWL